jgi:hypothetical protein
MVKHCLIEFVLCLKNNINLAPLEHSRITLSIAHDSDRLYIGKPSH